jgi:transcriptional regulator with XRE-family HTH domain
MVARHEIQHETAQEGNVTSIVAGNLRRLRRARGLSLERLGRAAGVSRAMLGQIELSQSTPTIGLLWKVASALEVPVSRLLVDPTNEQSLTVLRQEQAKVLRSDRGGLQSRALFPPDRSPRVEFYELVLPPECIEHADGGPPGTKGNLVLAAGALVFGVGSDEVILNAGDAVHFDADLPHRYANRSTLAAVMYLVLTYL